MALGKSVTPPAAEEEGKSDALSGFLPWLRIFYFLSCAQLWTCPQSVLESCPRVGCSAAQQRGQEAELSLTSEFSFFSRYHILFII